jgi:large exoprotein involved in heme utilization and adhesion
VSKTLSSWFGLSLCTLCTLGYLCATNNPASAQVTSDGTVNTQVTENGRGLEVATGNNLTLLGGNIRLEGGNIFAPGGRVELGGLTTEGTVSFNDNNGLNVPQNISRGNVSLTQGAVIDVTSGNGGFVTVNANNLEILDGSTIIAGIGEGLGALESQAGDITLNVADRLTLQGEANTSSSRISNVVNTNGLGNAGNVIINTASLEGIGNFAIGSFTFGQGDAGQVIVTASENVSFAGLEGFSPGIASAVADGATGNGNDIIINASSLSLSNQTQLVTSTSGDGNAGNITVNATDSISLSDGSGWQAATFGEGNGGNIEISTANLSLTDGSTIIGTTFGQGDAGAVNINATGDINIDGENSEGLSSSVDSRVGIDTEGNAAEGNAGGISISTNNLTLTNGGTVNASTFGQGNAGLVKIDADNILVDGAGVVSGVAETGVGDAGGIEITTGELALTNGGVVDGRTLGQGDAGELKIQADESISLSNSSRITSTVGTGAVGNGGNINISANNLTLTEGSQVQTGVFGTVENVPGGIGNAGDVNLDIRDTLTADGFSSDGFSSGVFTIISSGAEGDGGKINLTTSELSLTNGAIVNGRTSGRGNAGLVTIDADNISVDGVGSNGSASGVFSNVQATGVGNAGGIDITTGNLSLNNGARILVSTFGRGDAGLVTIDADNVSADGVNSNGFISGVFSTVEGAGVGNAGGIEITTDELALTNGGVVNGSTFGQGNAGLVKIDADIVSLDGNSFIAAQAFGDTNGGNLRIDANYIIAFPSNGRGNDLIAGADRGRGGDIDLNVEQLFGLERGDAINDEGIFSDNDKNDIDASSNVFGFDGTVNINTSDINPIQGATELPSNVVELEQNTAQACEAGRGTANNGLAIAGKGGVTPTPDAPLNSENIISPEQNPAAFAIPEPIETSQGKIQPARGIRVTKSGNIILTAYPTNNAGERIPEGQINCGQR